MSRIVLELEVVLTFDYAHKVPSQITDLKIDWITSMNTKVNDQDKRYKGTETILLVDDEAEIREVLSEFMIDFGYNVIIAEDGLEAIKKFKENAQYIHMVIMDVVMPRKDGILTFKEIKQMDPTARIVLMSGYYPECLKTQYDLKVLQKPFQPLEMIKIIRHILDEK